MEMPQSGFPIFVDAPPDFQIKTGHVHVRLLGIEFCATVHTLKESIKLANRALDEWSETSGRVVPIKKPKR